MDKEDKSTTVTVTVTSFDLDRWQQGGLSSFSETCFSEYWNQLAPDSIIPSVSQEQSHHVNPYSFAHRMTLGKYLIEQTGGDNIWGKNCSLHWFWGYLAQLDWQRRSGRLENPGTWNSITDIDTFERDRRISNDDNISKESWWGYMNLQFSVAVYCGAAEAGLVPIIQLGTPFNKNEFGYQQCVQHWKNFWDTHHRDFVASIRSSATETQRKEALSILYRHLWETHTNVIQCGIANAKQLENKLPEEDRNVGLGWCNMVELLSAMSWTHLSVDALCEFGVGYLPTIRLAGPETVQWIAIHRPKEYVTIQNLYKLRLTSPAAMKQMCIFWSRVTRWSLQRDTMARTLNTLSHGNGPAKVLAFTKIFILSIAPKSVTEISIWMAIPTALLLCASRRK
ncbi:hypothetical protein IV203_020724 [Nitzschia inconspicua]|uniref:Leg1 family protein n=1 Tax=Nitzschia inconspicua TaxID=303405 RepID=A0A9K3PB62_9STRA|nr:Leg1 family protein [Nitzschia inconspicua]KAG7342780.1 hypothetical protein IV203_020724 [Nitzschia inconspicua]